MKQEMCPFCQFMVEDVELYQPIEYDAFGQPAKIGHVRSCDGCARVAQMSGTTEDLLHQLEQVGIEQAQAKAELEFARHEDLKKLAAWNAMSRA